jgi:hypothetical protein
MGKGVNRLTITSELGCRVKIKTSLSVDEELWKNFSITVLHREGGRKLSEVIEVLMK